jgi:uncharacterized protein (TIGR02145 family)
MKNIVKILALLMVFLLINSCKKDKDPILDSGYVTDIDGNEYKTITIGTQTWMAENLKTTRYNNGDSINPHFPDNYQDYYKEQFAYDNNESNIPTYGRLYKYGAVYYNNRNICPTGWHVPTYDDWRSLGTYLNGSIEIQQNPRYGVTYKNIANSMKATLGWGSNNVQTNNTSGFSALPGGLLSQWKLYPTSPTGPDRSPIEYSGLGSECYFSCSTRYVSCTECIDQDFFYTCHLSYDSDDFEIFCVGGWDYMGESVRCIKDD